MKGMYTHVFNPNSNSHQDAALRSRETFYDLYSYAIFMVPYPKFLQTDRIFHTSLVIHSFGTFAHYNYIEHCDVVLLFFPLFTKLKCSPRFDLIVIFIAVIVIIVVGN